MTSVLIVSESRLLQMKLCYYLSGVKMYTVLGNKKRALLTHTFAYYMSGYFNFSTSKNPTCVMFKILVCLSNPRKAL